MKTTDTSGKDLSYLRKHIMENVEYSPSMKLALLWLFENGVEEFTGKDLYTGIACNKVHWNNWLRPRMIEAKWIRRENRTTYTFFNIATMDIF